MLPTSFVLTFDSPLDPARADSLASYRLVNLANPRQTIRLRSATYTAAQESVTLRPIHRVYLYDHYQLTVTNLPSMAAGDPVDVGTSGGNFVTTVTLANLVLTAAQSRDKPVRRISGPSSANSLGCRICSAVPRRDPASDFPLEEARRPIGHADDRRTLKVVGGSPPESAGGRLCPLQVLTNGASDRQSLENSFLRDSRGSRHLCP